VIEIDQRWIKGLNLKAVDEASKYALSVLSKPVRHNISVISVYMSSYEALPISHVCDEGVYIQFELPVDCLPSFVGIAGTISYLVVITIQLPDGLYRANFPFKVHGLGSSNYFSNHLSFPLCAFAASSLSYDSFVSSALPSLSTQPQGDHDDGDEDTNQENTHYSRQINRSYRSSYAIQDIDRICIVSFHGHGPPPANTTLDSPPVCLGVLHPGEALWVELDFSTGKQSCDTVRVKIVQREKHPDGSRLQVPLPLLLPLC
jgi:hypothetical protein